MGSRFGVWWKDTDLCGEGGLSYGRTIALVTEYSA